MSVDAQNARQAGAQELHEFALVRQLFRGGHEHDHVAIEADAADNMAQDAGVAVFMINRDAELFDNIAHGIDDVVVPLPLDAAVRRVDDAMAALRKAADNGMAFVAADRKLHFVAVVPRRRRADGREDVQVFLLADARDGVNDLLALRAELCHVVHVHELAAAAVRVNRARRGHAVTARFQNLDDMAARVGFLDVVNGGADGLAGQGARDEDGEVVLTADTLAAGAEGVDLEFVSFALFDRHLVFHGLSFRFLLSMIARTAASLSEGGFCLCYVQQQNDTFENSSIGFSSSTFAPCSTSSSFGRKPQRTPTGRKPALWAVSMSTLVSPK